MFATSEGTIDHTLERARAADRRAVLAIRDEQARLDRELIVIMRRVEDRGDWKAAGCASSTQWLAQLSDSEYRTAARITRTAEALRELPALDDAVNSGVLTLDQAAATLAVATPASDAQLARLAVGKAPSEITRAARVSVPPKVADDAQLYQRRALSMTWVGGGRELAFNGRLPLEQGAAFEQAIWNIAKPARAGDKKASGETLEWQQYTADALVTLATRTSSDGADGEPGVRRSPTTLIVHLGRDEPPFIEGAGPISRETAERLACDARRLTIKPHGRDLVHSRVRRCASYPQLRALAKRSRHCQYPGCTALRELDAHHLTPYALRPNTEIDELILLCPRHHKLIHDHHIRTAGTGAQPTFTDRSGRAITANRPHAPP